MSMQSRYRSERSMQRTTSLPRKHGGVPRGVYVAGPSTGRCFVAHLDLAINQLSGTRTRMARPSWPLLHCDHTVIRPTDKSRDHFHFTDSRSERGCRNFLSAIIVDCQVTRYRQPPPRSPQFADHRILGEEFLQPRGSNLAISPIKLILDPYGSLCHAWNRYEAARFTRDSGRVQRRRREAPHDFFLAYLEAWR